MWFLRDEKGRDNPVELGRREALRQRALGIIDRDVKSLCADQRLLRPPQIVHDPVPAMIAEAALVDREIGEMDQVTGRVLLSGIDLRIERDEAPARVYLLRQPTDIGELVLRVARIAGLAAVELGP